MMATFASNVSMDSDFGQRDVQWWRKGLTDRQIHEKLSSAVKKIRTTQLWRKSKDIQHYRLYGNSPILGFGLQNYAKTSSLGANVGLNIVRSASDALTAKLCTDEMMPRLLTNGGDWDLQQRAKELEKFIDGQAQVLGVDELIPAMVLQACIFGTGVLKPTIIGKGDKQRINLELVPTWAIMVDDQEALYGKPPTFYQRMWYDRMVLHSMFRGNKAAQALIAKTKAQVDEDLESIGYQATADQVLVTEAWRLPSGPGEEDGCHSMMVENGLLYSEGYEYDEPPFIFYTLWPQPLGFFGVGISQQLQGLQIELNLLMTKVQRSFHLLGVGHVMLDRGSKANKHKLDNQIGSIWEYVGKAPEIVAVDPVAPQIFAHMDRIYTRAYEIAGISQLEAAALKPQGLDAGVALDTYLDITTERFNVSQRRLRNAFLGVCRWILRLATTISESNPKFGVLYPEQNHASMIHFKKNELEDDKYILRLYATNELADEPSEKMQQVQNMVNAGWIDNQTARRLIDFPDLEEYENLDLSAYNAVEASISKMLKDGTYQGPEKFLPIGTQGQPGPAIKQVQNALVRAWSKGAPDAKLRMLKQWISDAVALMPPPPPMPAAPGAPPGAAAPGAIPGLQQGSGEPIGAGMPSPLGKPVPPTGQGM